MVSIAHLPAETILSDLGVRDSFLRGLNVEYEHSEGFRRVRRAQAVERYWVGIAAAYPWDWFATHTYDRRRVSVAGLGRADGQSNRVMRNWQAWLYRALERTASGLGYGHDFRRSWLRGRRWTQPVWVAGVEAQNDGVPHVHAVVYLPEFARQARRDEAWSDWKRNWGFARLEPPRAVGDAAAYVSKYVSKGELFLSDTYNAYLGTLAPGSGLGVAAPSVAAETR